MRSALFVFIGLSTSASAQTFQQRAQAVLDSVYLSDTTMVGLMLHVEVPDRGIAWSGASGRSAKGGEALHPEAPFLIASNIKTYVSATILRLVEEGKLTIDQPVGPLLTEPTRALFAMASPAMRGREGGSLDEMVTSVWVAEQYAKLGLEPDTAGNRRVLAVITYIGSQS